jgi:glucose-1-phosphate thymidylyltransferase
MKIVIPMAGKGKRMRPHTLTTPKPLIKIAGQTIVSHLLSEVKDVLNEKIQEVHFVIGDFGERVEEELKDLARMMDARPVISYQDKPLGTAHAVYCAQSSLRDKVIVAFADTLFKASFILDTDADGIIWTKRVNNPGAFGVVKKDGQDYVDGFYEKPQQFISDEAIIGIYYFRQGQELKKEIEYLMEHNLMGNGEYQLTDALENLRQKGKRFKTSIVEHWFDCGNKDATVQTNQEILKHNGSAQKGSETARFENSVLIQPCYIGKDVELVNSVVGPYVSIEDGTRIVNSLVRNSIIQSASYLESVNILGSMIGNNVNMEGKSLDMSVGDYTNIKL